MAKVNSWVLTKMGNLSFHAQVRDVVHRTTLAHQRVLAAHREWRRTDNPTALIEACDAFVELVAELTA